MINYSRDNPSNRYKELVDEYRKSHEQGFTKHNLKAEDTFSGLSILPHIDRIKHICDEFNINTILDYGSGKGQQYCRPIVKDGGEKSDNLIEFWNAESVHCYDAGYRPFSVFPTDTYDAVISTDVLEHCPNEDIDWIIDEIFSLSTCYVFANVACYPAVKTLGNGENAHCTIKPSSWWIDKFKAASKKHPERRWTLISSEKINNEMKETTTTN